MYVHVQLFKCNYTNIKNVCTHFSRINDYFIRLHNYADVCVLCMCTCYEHISFLLNQLRIVDSFILLGISSAHFFIPFFSTRNGNIQWKRKKIAHKSQEGEHKHTHSEREKSNVLFRMKRREKEERVFGLLKCGLRKNMRDSNVTFNTLLKDNKNQVKRDSLHFPLALCTSEM